MLKNITNIWLVSVLIIGLGLACDGNQTSEANKLVGETNDILKNYNELVPKSDKLDQELGGKIKTLGNSENFDEDWNAFKTENKSKIDEFNSVNEQLVKLSSDAADKCDQASKLKLDDKLKEYFNVQTQIWKKRNELNKLNASSAKAMLEAKDANDITKLNDSNKKGEDLQKEIDELQKKADQLGKDLNLK